MDIIKVLDHGYLKLIESWGSDERIIEAARMSTGKGFQGWGPKEDGKPGDEKLLRFLWEHKHATPFEMAGVIIEVQAPIFVFREWHRHRTQSYNEMSARYTPLPDLNYIPSRERILSGGQSTSNKQGGGMPLNETVAANWLFKLANLYAHAQEVYESGLNLGIAKEIARLPVPVARYSRMRASANLRNWLAFLTLRMDASAQWEIRQYANAVGSIVKELFPRSWELFVEGVKK
jgi:thymidylate synthase (FAD)